MAEQRLVLMKLQSADRCVFFVLRQPKYDHEAIDWTPEADRYYFEEHSCPTNWITDVVGIIEDGNEDPHGFLEFVRAVDVPEGFDPSNPHRVPGKNYGDTSIPAWAKIFPEVGNGI